MAINSFPIFNCAITNKLNNNNSFIFVFLIENVHNCKKKYANTKNDNNMQVKTFLYICTIKNKCRQKNRKIIIERYSN